MARLDRLGPAKELAQIGARTCFRYASSGRSTKGGLVRPVGRVRRVCGLRPKLGLNPLYTIAVVICAAVPTAKTVYILSGEYKVEEPLVAASVSMTVPFRAPPLAGCETPSISAGSLPYTADLA